MSRLHDVSCEFSDNTLAYIQQLDQQSSQVVQLVDSLPLHPSLRSELEQMWYATREKLAFFHREFTSADGKLQEDLTVLHAALLPEVISYQVKLGAIIIGNNCSDHRYLQEWKSIWTNIDVA
jgi:hypothetical protein